MTGNFALVLGKVFTLLLLIAAGYTMAKVNKLTERGVKQISDVLLYIVTPALIISTFEIPFDVSKLTGLGIAAASAIITHVMGIFIVKLLFRREPDGKRRILRYSVIYSNAGFMAVPLIDAVAGREGVLYGVVYVAVLTIFAWTHGVKLISGEASGISQMFFNPGLIGTVIALLVFFFSVSLPAPLHDALNMAGDLNTPLAMIVIGASIAQIELKMLFSEKGAYVSAAFRLVIIPFLLICILHWFNLPEVLYRTCVISACAPTAANTTLFAARFSKDTAFAGKLVAFSTVCSVLTMPLMVALAV